MDKNKLLVSKQKYFHTAKYLSDTGSNKRYRSVHDAVKHILDIYSSINGRKSLSQINVLDVGSGIGEYALEIAKYTNKVVGVEPYDYIYQQSLLILKKYDLCNKITFNNVLVEDFETNQKFDLVVSITTIEHMPNAEKSFKKIFELMKPGALIYLTAPNKLWPIECHYHLPFLSYLPLSLANLYVRVAGRGENYLDSAYSKSYFGMKSFFNKFDCTYKFVLPNPNSLYLGCGNSKPVYKFIKNMGIRLIRRFPIFWIFSKGFIMLIIKK